MVAQRVQLPCDTGTRSNPPEETTEGDPEDLAPAWPGSGCCGHRRSDPADGRSPSSVSLISNEYASLRWPLRSGLALEGSSGLGVIGKAAASRGRGAQHSDVQEGGRGLSPMPHPALTAPVSH